MTTQESFKKRIRARMAETGERYNAARRVLLTRAGPRTAGSGWVSQPEAGDATIRENTGRGWDEWVRAIDAGPGREAGHTEIAAWVGREHGVGGWWAQSVTVGYERITGLRLPGQMKDGTFTVSRSRTVDVEPEEFRASLFDEEVRAEMLPGLTSAPRSKPSTKAPKFSLADAETGQELGALQFRVDQYGRRPKLVITHEKLPSVEAAESWKSFWRDWLEDFAGEG